MNVEGVKQAQMSFLEAYGEALMNAMGKNTS